MASLLHKVRDAVSPSRAKKNDEQTLNDTASSLPAGEERGRGRATHQDHNEGHRLVSTGRGGAGNILRSKSPPANRSGAVDTPAERISAAELERRSRSRGRNEVAHVGRGGAGNIGSQSRAGDAHSKERESALEKEEEEVERKYREHEKEHPHKEAHGRGGAGNIQ